MLEYSLISSTIGMMEPITKAAIFDLDDTLLKTAVIKWRQHKAVAKEIYGIDLTDDVLREHWGKPFDILIGQLYQNADRLKICAKLIDQQNIVFQRKFKIILPRP